MPPRLGTDNDNDGTKTMESSSSSITNHNNDDQPRQQLQQQQQQQQQQLRQRRFLQRSDSSNMERGVGITIIGSSSSSSSLNFESSSDIINNTQTTTSTSSSSSKTLLLQPTSSLPLLNFIDMFAVALVVPLLFQYYKNAGITKANQRELLSSIFSSSQILGGVILGTLTDSKLVGRKTVLYISFGGSAIAYGMIAYGNFTTLILSRILVGLVKQTMTITTSLMTKCTTSETRAKYMGRLSSSTTGAWIFGPTIGGLLYKYVDKKAPVLMASFLFLINLILAFILLPPSDNNNNNNNSSTTKTSKSIFSDDDDKEQQEHDEDEDDNSKKKKKKRRGTGGSISDFWNNMKTCTRSKSLLNVICSTIIIAWMTRATSYANMGSYYEDMYGLEPHHRGYIQSYQRIFRIVVEFGFIGPILAYIGGERKAICLACITMAIATFWEIQQSLPIFLVVLAPMISISTTMIQISIKSLLTTVAPSDSIFSVFAVLDVLQNVAAVSVPFYRTILFQILGGSSSRTATKTTTSSSSGMEGDPDPVSWVFASGIHWVITAIAMTYFLSPYNKSNNNNNNNSRQQRSSAVKEL